MTPEVRIRFAFRQVTSRPPAEDELAVLVAGLNDDMAHFRQNPKVIAVFSPWNKTV